MRDKQTKPDLFVIVTRPDGDTFYTYGPFRSWVAAETWKGDKTEAFAGCQVTIGPHCPINPMGE